MTPLDAFLAVDLVPIATAVLTAVTCATLGNWLVLRKQAMLGDATSHAVLPGIVVAFLGTAHIVLGGQWHRLATVTFAAGDLIAVGAMKALLERGAVA